MRNWNISIRKEVLCKHAHPQKDRSFISQDEKRFVKNGKDKYVKNLRTKKQSTNTEFSLAISLSIAHIVIM